METRVRTSTEQFAAIIEFMERYGDLSRPCVGAVARFRADRLWQELTNILNSDGIGVQKTPEKWKKVWADWKAKTKKKALHINCESQGGKGGGHNTRHILNPIEERLLSIMGMPGVKGQDGLRESGFSECQIASELKMEILDEELMSPSTQQEQEVAPNILQTDVVLDLPEPSAMRFEEEQNFTRPTSAQSRRSDNTIHRIPNRRRLRQMTSFKRASALFVNIEERRLQLEEIRESKLHEREILREQLMHEREMRRLEIEAQKVEVQKTFNNVLMRLTDVAEKAVDHISSPGFLLNDDRLRLFTRFRRRREYDLRNTKAK